MWKQVIITHLPYISMLTELSQLTPSSLTLEFCRILEDIITRWINEAVKPILTVFYTVIEEDVQ